MEINTKVRILRKVIRKLNDECNEGIEMGSLMDGSGECGKFYIPAHLNSLELGIQTALMQLDITEEEYEAELKKIAKKEDLFCTAPWNSYPDAANDLSILSIPY